MAKAPTINVSVSGVDSVIAAFEKLGKALADGISPALARASAEVSLFGGVSVVSSPYVRPGQVLFVSPQYIATPYEYGVDVPTRPARPRLAPRPRISILSVPGRRGIKLEGF